MAISRGTAGDDNLTGTSGNDQFLLWQGGDDTVDAGDGNDIIRMGAALNAADKIDGGTGRDVVVLNGDYSAGLVFNADTITNVEVFNLVGHHSYNLTLNDGNVAAGANLLIRAGSLVASDSLTFDGSAETDGRFFVFGGAGDDTVTGGAQSDHLHLEKGGVDIAHGGGGNDVFYMGDQLWSDDQIDGGSGYDVVYATGFSGGDSLALTGTTLQNVEDFVLDGGSFLGVTTDDGTVAAGATLTIDASAQTTAFFFDGSAETDGRFNVIAGSGDDNLTGGAGADTFHLEHGGTDTASGGDGNDTFYLGGTFTSADQIDGGAGIDTVVLDGMGDDAIGFTSTTMTNIEKLVLDPGHFYTIVTGDAAVAAGQVLTVDGSKLGAGDPLEFDGSGETDGRFNILAGAGNDTITGGALGDTLHLETGGNDFANGGAGNDHFFMGASLTAADQIQGGSGYDTVILNGGVAVTFSATTMTGVEQIDLTAGHSYSLTTNDAAVAAGQFLTIDGSVLGAGNALTFDGSAETDGSFDIVGGAGNDVITGGKFGDLIDLSVGGNDRVTLGQGFNLVNMGAALTAADRIDGRLGLDVVFLDGDYTGAHAVVFAPGTMVNVDTLEVIGGFSYDLTSNDVNVGAGHIMTVDGSLLGIGDSIKFDGSAETNGAFDLIDGLGNDVLKGGAGEDFLSFDGGGTDTGIGGGGDDFIDACGHFDVTDHFDGGMGTNDAIELTASETASGNYTGADALVLTASMMSNIEVMLLDNGGSYDITTVDASVATGSSLTVDGSILDASDNLTFDGSAETDGSFILIDGLGNDVLKGGAGNDSLSFDAGGTDMGQGGGGDDFIDACGHFDVTDQFDGGTGTDTIELTASDAGATGYTGANALVLTASMMTNIEVMQLDNGGSYDITTVDANVAAGSSLTVDGSTLGASDSLTFDGSAETDGSFDFIAGASLHTHLTGGAGNDTFDLTGVDPAADTQAFGSGGNDTFQFLSNFDSSSQVVDGGTGANTLSLDGDYSAISLVGSGIIDNIQTVTFAGGHSYTGIQVFDDVAGGGTLTLDATALQSGDAFGLDASLSTDAIHLMAGDGTYTVTGSAQDDTFDMGAIFTAADSIDGGAGTDTVTLNGDYSAGLVFGATTMTNVETLTLLGAFDYSLTTDDATVAAGVTLTVDAVALGASHALTFDGSAETDGSFSITGGAGDDVLTGGAQNDGFNLTQGGNDTASGGAGNDTFSFGAAFTASDTIDGGANSDTLSLNGDYSAGVVFTATTMMDVENIVVQAGHDYDLTTVDATVASGATLNVTATTLGTGDTLTFDGSAETDGKFRVFIDSADVLANSQITGGAGDDTLVLNGDFFSTPVAFGSTTIQSIENITLTAGNSYSLSLSGDSVATGATIAIDGSALGAGDHFYFGFDTTGAADSSYTLTGGAGDDGFFMLDAFSASDKIDGGSGGNDEIQINGDYSAGVTFNADTVKNIGYFAVLNGNSYSLTENDGNVAAGATMAVTGSILGASNYLHFYGAAETDGHFDLIGGAGDDILEGGNLGDTLTGNGGADTFLYTTAAQSSSTSYDAITDFAAGTDHLDLTTAVTTVFAVSGSLDSGANFDSELAGLGVIQASGAAVLTVTGGTLAGHTFLVVDGNGDDVYTAGQDYVFDITNYTGTITTNDFI